MKRILVHLDASTRTAVRLTLAQRLARDHGSELTAMYAVLPSYMASAWSSGEGLAYAASSLAELDRAQRERAREAFDQAAAHGAMQWLDAGNSPYHALLQQAYTSDLVVLGQADLSDRLTGELPLGLVPDLLTDSGRPTLLIPRGGDITSVGEEVLIAWKPSRQAAAAVTGALPWLRRARHVHLAAHLEETDDGSDTTSALAHWLQLQGVTAPLQRHLLGAGSVGDALLSLACDTSADLLVMGCYGHSRAREWVLGGVTRQILGTMTLPVLMVH